MVGVIGVILADSGVAGLNFCWGCSGFSEKVAVWPVLVRYQCDSLLG